MLLQIASRKFYLVATFLGVVACFLHLDARQQMLEGQRLKAQAIRAAVEQAVKAMPNAAAEDLSRSGRLLWEAGFAFTGFALLALGLGLWRRERGWYSIPVMIVVFDIVWAFLL